MEAIYKYKLDIVDRQKVKMPSRFKILKAANQNGRLCLWAQVDTEYPESNLDIYIAGTGQNLQNVEGVYFDSVQIDEFVWHIFI